MNQSSNFTPLAVKSFPKKALAVTPENRFWKKYERVFSHDCGDAVQ